MLGTRRPRVLMLGWEYPPLFAGGLGKASQGLARGLAECGAEVRFVLPRYPLSQEASFLTVGGVSAWLALGRHRGGSPWTLPRKKAIPGLKFLAVPARLYPYQRPIGIRVPATRTADDARDPVDAGDPGDPAVQLYSHDLGRQVARFAIRVARLAPGIEADVVHANDWMSFPAAFAAAAPLRLPVFLHVHSTEYDRSGEAVNPYIASIEQQACARATHVFAVSRYTANVLVSRYGVPRRKITVVYNAPDEPADALDESPAGPGRVPWVVFLGRLTFQKGPDHFLRAAARVAEFNREARFLVCGSGDMSDGLHALARSLGIARRVEFRGFLQPAAVDRLLARSRVLVMSSVSEPFGLVALEALRNGTPVILSKQSGVREVLGHSLQVDFWDHEKLADQILALLRLPVLGQQLVESGREQLAQLSWESSARKVLQTYTRVCGLPLPAAAA
ncbi:MAG: glycosyltransferase family 4 protein [Gammaproteobacteria bacterium]|nr:glycosyltransferase family 4 protein [Gammaproteobacteria bacterium]